MEKGGRALLPSLAILIAGVMVAFSIAATFRYEISGGGNQIYRLDRWTAAVSICSTSMADIDKRARLEPVQVYCKPRDER